MDSQVAGTSWPCASRRWAAPGVLGQRQQASFWSAFKTMYYDRHAFATGADAIRVINSWIENVYHRRRGRSAFGQISAVACEHRLTTARLR